MNILGIGRDKSQSYYFPRRLTELEGELERGHMVATTPPWCGPAQAMPGHGVGPLAGHRPCLLRLYIPPEAETLNHQASSHEKFHSAAATEGEIRGIESLYSGTLPGRGSAPEPSPSISTAISIVVADSHDEEGVVLPRG